MGAMARRPHVLLFNPDQWRGDVLGHLGNHGAVTPRMDVFAREAVSFRWAFCQNPVCTPSRCSFMTGWYPHVAGHRTMYHMLRPHEPMLLKTLKENGYFTFWGGKNDVVPGEDGGAGGSVARDRDRQGQAPALLPVVPIGDQAERA